MHRTEDLPQQSSVVGLRLQLGQAPLHPVQPFLALCNKLFR